jgi:hypothetical protein
MAAETLDTATTVGTCWFVEGVSAGTATLTVTGAGSSATVAVNVSAAPLAVTFGAAVPK